MKTITFQLPQEDLVVNAVKRFAEVNEDWSYMLATAYSLQPTDG